MMGGAVGLWLQLAPDDGFAHHLANIIPQHEWSRIVNNVMCGVGTFAAPLFSEAELASL